MPTNKKPNKKITKSSPKATAKAKPSQKAAQSAKPKTAKMSKLAREIARRPPNNSAVPQTIIDMLTEDFTNIKIALEAYAAHLRALDRKRLNGVGIKKQGFIQRALEIAMENPEFLPNYLTLERFIQENKYFTEFRSLFDTSGQIRELIWNITMESSDVDYTNALDYYASVREAAKRRVDAAESPHKELAAFFKSMGTPREGEPTKKKLKSDMNALLNGKRDGKLVIENIKPKAADGAHKVLDEQFADNVQYKETDQGEIKE
jgi:hypothetical protein